MAMTLKARPFILFLSAQQEMISAVFKRYSRQIEGFIVEDQEVSIMFAFGCLFALVVSFFPRLALLFLWLFTPLVNRAFHFTFFLPLLGILFLPFTTIMYVLVNATSGVGVIGWGWLWVFVGLLLDLGSYGSGGYANRERIPGYNRA